MQSTPKKGLQNLIIGICCGLFCATGLVLISQSKSITELGKNMASTAVLNQGKGNNQPSTSTVANKATTFLQTVKESLNQPRDSPFQPEWSGEVYSPDRELDDAYQAALKRHVLLRQFYTSPQRYSPEFQKMYRLLVDWNFVPDTVQCMQLFDALQMIESIKESLNSDHTLTPQQSIKGLEKIYQDRTKNFAIWVKESFGSNDSEFLEALKMIRPKNSFGAPDTRIEPNEPLLVR